MSTAKIGNVLFVCTKKKVHTTSQEYNLGTNSLQKYKTNREK